MTAETLQDIRQRSRAAHLSNEELDAHTAGLSAIREAFATAHLELCLICRRRLELRNEAPEPAKKPAADDRMAEIAGLLPRMNADLKDYIWTQEPAALERIAAKLRKIDRFARSPLTAGRDEAGRRSRRD